MQTDSTPPAPRITRFEQILDTIKNYPVRRLAVAVAQDHAILRAVKDAHDKNVAEHILVGDRDAILRVADEAGITLADDAILHKPDPVVAVRTAVQLVHSGDADILVKGYLHTDDFLRPVLDKECGLRSQAIMSHVFIWETLDLGRLIFLTDGAMNIAPTLERKADIILNAVHLATMFGVEKPKVAMLAAVELVNPDMPVTIEAAALASMASRHQFSVPCSIDGPFAFDNAISMEAAKTKKMSGPVAGQADVLVVPDIEAGNMLAKSFSFLGCGDTIGVIVGAKNPIVLTSRADSPRSKLFSIATAVLMSTHERELRLKIGRVHY